MLGKHPGFLPTADKHLLGEDSKAVQDQQPEVPKLEPMQATTTQMAVTNIKEDLREESKRYHLNLPLTLPNLAGSQKEAFIIAIAELVPTERVLAKVVLIGIDFVIPADLAEPYLPRTIIQLYH